MGLQLRPPFWGPVNLFPAYESQDNEALVPDSYLEIHPVPKTGVVRLMSAVEKERLAPSDLAVPKTALFETRRLPRFSFDASFHGGFGDRLYSCQVILRFDSVFLPLVCGIAGGDDVVLALRVKVCAH